MQYELAVGKSPYPEFETPFQRIEYIVDKEAPQLTSEADVDKDCCDFINHWYVPRDSTLGRVMLSTKHYPLMVSLLSLTKDVEKRPRYPEILVCGSAET